MGSLLEAVNVRVVYPNGVVANDDLSLEVRRGEVLALLGENGAGKTTFIKVIAGIVKPNSGELLLEGRSYKPSSYRDAMRHGIYMVPQMPRFFEGLTVLEDLILTLNTAGIKLSRGKLISKVNELRELLDFNVNLLDYPWSLSMGEKQKVEIFKALLVGSRLVMFDEPTTHMTPYEFSKFKQLLRRLTSKGTSVIFVSHKIPEVLEVADRVAVMRKGKVVGVLDARDASEELLLKLMFGNGHTVNYVTYDSNLSGTREGVGELVLEVRDLWVKGYHGELAVRGVSFGVRRGEVLGIAGIAGNGQRELFEALIGLRKPVRGSIVVDGEDVTFKGPEYRVRKGLAVIPEERLGWGLAPGLTIATNIALSLIPVNHGLGGILVNWSRVREIAEKAVAMVNVKSTGVDMLVDALSGGNMQKLIVARELLKKPRVVIAMNPTGGLDASTAISIRRMILEHAKNSAVVVISEDLDEILSMSSKVIVLSKGSVKGVFLKPFNLEDLTKAMIS